MNSDLLFKWIAFIAYYQKNILTRGRPLIKSYSKYPNEKLLENSASFELFPHIY